MDIKESFNPNELSQNVPISNLVVAFFLHENVHKMIRLSSQILVLVRQDQAQLTATGLGETGSGSAHRYWS
ncbi:hypothetical protein DPMN_141468 [Dreissena polymorpha]|uniref:Uncharacterized protein n=1 Tax=Dreissena polymorpha TaxID=45954 RepID=A0A9D4JIB5_DREPO|nr:hypothetical protein DPMN_141468 [Dreissena polymorpha]